MCATLSRYNFLSPIPGLDPSGYRQSVDRREEQEEKALLGAMMSSEEKYKDCDRFHFTCPKCGRDIIFDNLSSELVSPFVHRGTVWWLHGASRSCFLGYCGVCHDKCGEIWYLFAFCLVTELGAFPQIFFCSHNNFCLHLPAFGNLLPFSAVVNCMWYQYDWFTDGISLGWPAMTGHMYSSSCFLMRNITALYEYHSLCCWPLHFSYSSAFLGSL